MSDILIMRLAIKHLSGTCETCGGLSLVRDGMRYCDTCNRDMSDCLCFACN